MGNIFVKRWLERRKSNVYPNNHIPSIGSKVRDNEYTLRQTMVYK